MPLFRHPPCLWASRTQLRRRPGIVPLRWRSGAESRKKFAKGRGKYDGEKQVFRHTEDLSASATGSDRHISRPRHVEVSGREDIDRRPGAEVRHDHVTRTKLFSRLVERTLSDVLKGNFRTKQQNLAWGLNGAESKKRGEEFQKEVRKQCRQAEGQLPLPPLFAKFRQAFIKGSTPELEQAVRLAFSNFLLSPKFSAENFQRHEDISDLTYPSEWFPATRALQRKVVLHVGPTNSGKTYHALKRLEEAKTGIFAGPLRLLAHEVYTRFNAKNVPCALVTGEERRLPPGLDASKEVAMRSCTVEMVPLNTRVDVAVIDEIQMLGDSQRGWAWTQAFLGVQAKELHLCGEERTVPLIEDLCALIGDELEVHHYKRLSPLKAMDSSIEGNLKALRKGDCVISFSRVGIHRMKLDIERATGKRCAVVYGSLPPETRAQQAALFNDPDNDYDFLAASDAIGMGLNLSIKRVIFEKLWKYNGIEDTLLTVPQLKQIAGRAGRYRTATQGTQTEDSKSDVLDPGFSAPAPEGKSVGLVTSFYKQDIPLIKSAISKDPGPLTSAGIFPNDAIIEKFAALFPPQTPFSYILLHVHELASLHPLFHLCELKEQTVLADIIQRFKLTIPQRLTFINAPVPLRQKDSIGVVESLARCVAEQSGGDLVDISAIDLELLDEPEQLTDKVYLNRLEALHNAVNLYLWLSYRFAGIFRSVSLGFHVKGLVEEKINRCLAAVTGRRRSGAADEMWREKKLRALLKRSKKGQEEEMGDAEVMDGERALDTV